MDVLINASPAIKNQGNITVSTDAEDDNIKVGLSDTGSSIPAEKPERRCAPFFTTKETGGDTGLGLPISSAIVTKHGGKIEVES